MKINVDKLALWKRQSGKTDGGANGVNHFTGKRWEMGPICVMTCKVGRNHNGYEHVAKRLVFLCLFE